MKIKNNNYSSTKQSFMRQQSAKGNTIGIAKINWNASDEKAHFDNLNHISPNYPEPIRDQNDPMQDYAFGSGDL